jgi:hypothetical protein
MAKYTRKWNNDGQETCSYIQNPAICWGRASWMAPSLVRFTVIKLADNIEASQYNETNVKHLSFSLLRIKDLYMFRALLAHPQEALHKRHLVYCVRIMSVGCDTVAVSVQWNQRDALFIQVIENQRPLHVSSITCSSSGGFAQTAFGILRAYNVSWLWHACSETATVIDEIN